MPRFQYKAINRAGQSVQGKIDADSASLARAILAEQGLFVDEVVPGADGRESSLSSSGKRTSRLRLSGKERTLFISQLATALQARLGLLTALQVLGEQNPRPAIKQLVRELTDTIRSGQSLSYALSQYPAIFSRLHSSMAAVGESSGSLDQIMGQLGQLEETELQTKSEIMTAALYPSFVLALGLISAAVVVSWVLPQILSTLAAEVATLAWPTRVMIAVSDWLKVYGLPLLCGLLVGFWLFKRWKRTAIGRYLWDSFTLRLPVYGSVIGRWSVSRFARTLGTLCRGGIDILDSLQIVRNTLGNEVLAREIDQITSQVRAGKSLAASLRQSGRFPPLLVQVVSVGEETGRLAEQLLGVADAFERETQVAIKRFMAIFPAFLILLLALVIGFIVAATLLPIIQIETAIPGL